MFACLTRAESGDESDQSSCTFWRSEAYEQRLVCSIRLTINTTRATVDAAIFVAASCKCRHNAELLGFPHPCAWTAERASNVEDV